MPTITIRGLTDATLDALRSRAAAARRSLNGELLSILDAAVDSSPPAGNQVIPEPTAQPYAAVPVSSLLEDVDRAALAATCRRHRITWLAVFGSHARGDARAGSDVDVVVDFAPGATPGFGMVRVAESLAGPFGGRRVDLVTRRGLAPRLRERVLAEARELYATG
jgi:uncharacterized protein